MGPPDPAKDVTHAFGTLALILILFEGGLDLNIRETISHFTGGRLFGVVVYAITTLSAGRVALASLGIDRRDGLLAGAVIGCTSGTIVLPVLQHTIVLAIENVEVRGQSMTFLPPMSFAVILLTNLILVFGSGRTSKMASAE